MRITVWQDKRKRTPRKKRWVVTAQNGSRVDNERFRTRREARARKAERKRAGR